MAFGRSAAGGWTVADWLGFLFPIATTAVVFGVAATALRPSEADSFGSSERATGSFSSEPQYRASTFLRPDNDGSGQVAADRERRPGAQPAALNLADASPTRAAFQGAAFQGGALPREALAATEPGTSQAAGLQADEPQAAGDGAVSTTTSLTEQAGNAIQAAMSKFGEVGPFGPRRTPIPERLLAPGPPPAAPPPAAEAPSDPPPSPDSKSPETAVRLPGWGAAGAPPVAER